MLERLQSIARGLRPVLPVAVVLGLAGLAVFLWSVTRNVPAERDTWLIPGVLAMVWGAVLFAFITGLRQVTPPPASRDPFGVRVRARLARGMQSLFAWIILGGAAAASFMTFRLVTLWSG